MVCHASDQSAKETSREMIDERAHLIKEYRINAARMRERANAVSSPPMREQFEQLARESPYNGLCAGHRGGKPRCATTSRSRSSLGVDFTVPRLLYCAFGCVLGGAVLDGAALGFALVFAFVFFFGVVVAPGVAGGAPVSCWASASDAVSSAAAGTASPVASPASKSTFRRDIRSSRIGRNSQPHQTPRG